MRATALALAVLLMSIAGGATAAVNASGSTGLRYDWYGLRGDTAALPWWREGAHFYQEAQVRLHAEADEARRWELNVSGVANHSAYRHHQRGLTAEWLNFRYEDGAAAIPHRVELGDQHVRFSPLTLDRRLQGARLELQPSGASGNGHSLVWMSGVERTDWRDGGETGNRYHAASWLVEDTIFGRYAVNVVRQEAGAPMRGTDTNRLVTSFAGEGSFSVGRLEDITAEAELAYLNGRATSGGPEGGQGLHMRVHGSDRALPLDYALGYGRYDEGFAPLGTAVVRDSSNAYANAGWQFPLDVEVRGRYDRDLYYASSERLQSHKYRLILDVPQTFGWLAWMDHHWEFGRRYWENAWGTVDNHATEASWSVRAADRRGGATRIAFSVRSVSDRSANDHGSLERRMALSHARQLEVGRVALSAAPGLDYRVREGSDETTSINPTLRLDAEHGRHKVGVRLDYRELQFGALGERDEYGMLVDYRYQVASHTVGVEYEQLGREHSGTADAQGWRAGVFWRYHFDTQLTLGN